MISVSVNNDAKQCDPQQPLTVLLAEWGFEREKIAVAVNGDFVPRSHYQQFTLSDGDRVEVVHAIGGG